MKTLKIAVLLLASANVFGALLQDRSATTVSPANNGVFQRDISMPSLKDRIDVAEFHSDIHADNSHLNRRNGTTKPEIAILKGKVVHKPFRSDNLAAE